MIIDVALHPARNFGAVALLFVRCRESTARANSMFARPSAQAGSAATMVFFETTNFDSMDETVVREAIVRLSEYTN
jgi:hypothetical protein